jgi:hypothetical protein
MKIRTAIASLPIAFVFLLAQLATAQSWQIRVGLTSLENEFGASLAYGAGVIACQVEAPLNNAYRPDPTASNFLNPNKTFIDQSNLNMLNSSHATQVGTRFYGNTNGIAQDVLTVNLYEANHWANIASGISTGTNPLAQPFGVQNHSWIGSGLSIPVATDFLSRIDYMVNQNDMCLVAGVNNNSTVPQLLAPMFNLLSVGLTAGTHSHFTTTFYTPGRVKPEIVAPDTLTSNATPQVSGACAILRDLADGTNANHNQAIRAAILAGATKIEFPKWMNSATVPLDTTFGVGELNVYNAYKILLNNETNGSPSTPATGGPSGWDYGIINQGQVLSYQIELTEPADHVSIALAWNIEVVDSNPNSTLFTPQTTLGNLDLFFSGNGIAGSSTSTNHNIEHIYLRDVPAGIYNIAIIAERTTPFGLAWRSASIGESNSQSSTLVTGLVRSGTTGNLNASDNQYFRILPGFDSANQQFAAVMEFELTSPVFLPNSIEFEVESRASTTNIRQQIELFDFTTSQYEVVSASQLATQDSTAAAYPTGEMMRFVQFGTGLMRARVRWNATGVILQFPWTISIDRVVWKISQ